MYMVETSSALYEATSYEEGRHPGPTRFLREVTVMVPNTWTHTDLDFCTEVCKQN